MKYYNSKHVDYSYDEAIQKVTDELKEEGFGVLTEIDVKDTLKNKIDVDFRKYKILGACNPSFAHKAILAEPNIGTLLPCNVVVQEDKNGKTNISMFNPKESMKTIDNEELQSIAEEITNRLNRVLDRV